MTLQISSKVVPEGDTKFTVKIIVPTSFILADYRFKLSDVTDERRGNEFKFGLVGGRDLEATQEGNVVICIFPVTEKELEDPKLSFTFFRPGRPEAWNIPHFYYVRIAQDKR